jgi:hypothetical protein
VLSSARGFLIEKPTVQASVWLFFNESAPLSSRHLIKVHVIVGYVLEFFAAAPSDPPSEYKRAAVPPPNSFIPSFPSNFLVSLHFDAITKMIPAESDLVRNWCEKDSQGQCYAFELIHQ